MSRRAAHTVLAVAMAMTAAAAAAPSAGGGGTRGAHVSARFKAPHAGTPEAVAARWRAADAALWEYVHATVPAMLDHTGSAAFDEHLKGVQAVLRYYDAPEHLTNAGLFHSIYGTEGFQGFALPLTQRETISGLIGARAERLCWMFCMADRFTVDATVHAWGAPGGGGDTYTFLARPELGRFAMVLAKEEWLDFLELTLMDWLEQVEGAAEGALPRFLWAKGEAYAYRRTAYAKIARVLAAERPARLGDVGAMLRAVMATEDPATRALVQPRTPPVSPAAEAAYAALRAAGEDIQTDFAPREAGGNEGEL